MKLKVIRYIPVTFLHQCSNQDDTTFNIDLLATGDFPKGVDPKSLVGKTVEIESLYPYSFIAEGVSIVSEDNQ